MTTIRGFISGAHAKNWTQTKRVPATLEIESPAAPQWLLQPGCEFFIHLLGDPELHIVPKSQFLHFSYGIVMLFTLLTWYGQSKNKKHM